MVLVTGGAGLVGKELITQLLAKGKQVRAVYNKKPALHRTLFGTGDNALRYTGCGAAGRSHERD